MTDTKIFSWGKELIKEGVYKLQAVEVTFDVNKYNHDEIKLKFTYANESVTGTTTETRTGTFYADMVERHCYQWELAKRPESPEEYRELLLKRSFTGQYKVDAFGNGRWYI